MKNPLTALLPAMALLALGGCASTAGLATSEDDGVYYSSKDRTTAVVAAAPAPAANSDEAANPDYHGSPARSQASQGSGSSQYYDNTYTYMKGVPTSPGLSYYTPYSPYTTLSYAGGYGYGWGGGACGFSPYPCVGGIYDPFYSPYSYYSPFGYGYRSGISVSFGFGYGRSYGYYGYSPFGYGYSPYGYGYGGFYDPFYSPYYYGGPFYGGYYGRGGYYGNSYYNGGNYGYGNNGSYDNRGNGRTYGHRTDRASEGRASSAGVSGGSTSAPVPAGGGRGRSEMVAQPSPVQATDGVSLDRSRGRADAGSTISNTAMDQSTGGFNRPQRLDRSEQPQYRNMDQSTRVSRQADPTPAPGKLSTDDSRGRWRNSEAAPQAGQMQPTAAPQPMESDRRRGGFFRNLAGDQPASNGGQMTEQPQRRSYEQPRQERTYEQPQRTFEQPQQRSYEQPQRTFSQPSYSAPSYGGGGGNGGGGGGGGRRGRD